MPERFFEKISRNMTDTEKMIMTNIIGSFVADNIFFGKEVLAHHPSSAISRNMGIYVGVCAIP